MSERYSRSPSWVAIECTVDCFDGSVVGVGDVGVVFKR